MKICGIVCEYNPFHNGHAYQLQEAKKRSGADAVVCVMGGNFTQRGEAALLPDTLRAKHAVQCGADAVIALPAVFSSAPAELFARGAIKILSSVPDFSCLSFGAEHADADFYAAADVLNDENAYFGKVKDLLSQGASFASARSEALKNSPVFPLLNSPNDVLAIEYARALSRAVPPKTTGATGTTGTENAARCVTLLPVERKGDYKARDVSGTFSSAAAIRTAVKNGGFAAARDCLPPAVYGDIQRFFQREEGAKNAESALQIAEKTAILNCTPEQLSLVLDCSEGLENALLCAAKQRGDVAKRLTSRRYTAARIKRICLHALLGITGEFIRECLSSPLYLRPLAVKKGREDVLSALAEGEYPLIIRRADERKLCETAQNCLQKDRLAEDMYRAVTGAYDARGQLFY